MDRVNEPRGAWEEALSFYLRPSFRSADIFHAGKFTRQGEEGYLENIEVQTEKRERYV